MNINLDEIYDDLVLDACSNDVVLDACSNDLVLDACSNDLVLDACSNDVVLDACSNDLVLDACSNDVVLDACSNDVVLDAVILSDKKMKDTDIVKHTLIHEFKNKFEFIDKTNLFNILIRCIELMKNTDIRPENQAYTSLEIIIHILETNALNVTTCPRFITILALKHDINKLTPLLNKIQEVMVMVDTLHIALQTLLHAYLSA